MKATITPEAIAQLADRAASIYLAEIAHNPARAEPAILAIRQGLHARLVPEQADLALKAILVTIENRLVAAGMAPTEGRIGKMAAMVRYAATVAP